MMRIIIKIIISFALLAISFTGLLASEADEPSIEISGKLDETLKLRYSVTYYTTRDSYWCKNYNFIAGLWPRKKKDYFYNVEGVGGEHKIKIPLQEIDADTYCEWMPQVIYFTASLKHDNDKESISPGGGSLISVWKKDGIPTHQINYDCLIKSNRSINRSYILCLDKGMTASMIKTLQQAQKILTVNFNFIGGNIQGD